MSHPVITNNLAQMRYNELLQEAQAARQRKGQKGGNAGFGAAILANVGAQLIAASQKLKTQNPSDVKTTA